MQPTRPFLDWLKGYANALDLLPHELEKEQALTVDGVVCAFVPGLTSSTATLLVDAGPVDLPHQAQILWNALFRNLENFAVGAPQFLFNCESRHLLIGQRFTLAEQPPETFHPCVLTLVAQARSWRAALAPALS